MTGVATLDCPMSTTDRSGPAIRANPYPPTGIPSRVWTQLACSRCKYRSEHPGPVSEGDLDRECGLCRAPLGAVTVFRVRGCSVGAGGRASGLPLGNEPHDLLQD